MDIYPFGNCNPHHYPMLGFIEERLGLCKPPNDFPVTEVAIATIAALTVGGILT